MFLLKLAVKQLKKKSKYLNNVLELVDIESI